LERTPETRFPKRGFSLAWRRSPRSTFIWRGSKRELFIDNLLVRIHFIIVMIRWAGLAPWEFESPFPGSLTSAFLKGGGDLMFHVDIGEDSKCPLLDHGR